MADIHERHRVAVMPRPSPASRVGTSLIAESEPEHDQQAPERELDALLLADAKQQACGSGARRF